MKQLLQKHNMIVIKYLSSYNAGANDILHEKGGSKLLLSTEV